MGVLSDGSYGIKPDVVYSFPVTVREGKYSIVQGLHISDFSRQKMDITYKELAEERVTSIKKHTNTQFFSLSFLSRRNANKGLKHLE
jgi:malate/lactate dehydrogenase